MITVIVNWFEDLPKDFQEIISIELSFLIPRHIIKDRSILDKPREIFLDFLNREDFTFLEYIGHIIFVKSLINYFFSNHDETKDDYRDKLLDKLSMYNNDEFLEKFYDFEENEVFKKSSAEKYINMSIDSIKRRLDNYEKDSITYKDALEKWEKIQDFISDQEIKKYKEDNFIKYIKF